MVGPDPVRFNTVPSFTKLALIFFIVLGAFGQSSYAQIERLVSMTGYGQLPGEAGPRRRTSEFSERAFHLSAEAWGIYDRGLQAMSQEAGKMLDMAEAMEYLFAEYLARRPLDEKGLEAARQEARQDLAAEQLHDEALLEKCPARDNSEWLATVGAREEECPGNGDVQLVAREKPHWKNPLARVPSPVRRRDLLRRDGYCCGTPGCPNHLYLETHHIVFYRHQGPKPSPMSRPSMIASSLSKL